MCDTTFHIGYKPRVREEAIDLLVTRKLGLTWPTVDKWLKEYKLAEAEIARLM